MGVKVQGVVDTEQMLISVDTTAKRRVVSALIDKGKELRDMAKRMAPVDEGNLVEAIKMTPEAYGGRVRDAQTGQFVRTDVEVYIDLDMPVPERPGKRVGDYAYEIHEHLEPAGPMKLGERSQQKQASSDVVVGGAFMTRAADALDYSIDSALRQALNEIF